MDDMFDRFFTRDFPWRPRGRDGGFLTVPALESFLRDDRLVIRADLPGIDPKGVDLVVEGDRLTIRGERKDELDDKDRVYREVSYGRFERTVQLPSGVDPDSLKAVYQDGVLEITMASPKGMGPKKIPIELH